MADRDDNDNYKEKDMEIDHVDTGEEGKLVDNEHILSIENRPHRAKSLGKDEYEETTEFDEEQDGEGDMDEDYDRDDNNEKGNDIGFTNAESHSHSSRQEGFFKKLKRKLGIRPKVHAKSASKKIVTVKYTPPPAPPNMPSARDAARARIYRKEKVRYGKEKLAYYLDGMRNKTLNVDDLVMKSEQNVHYIRGI